MGSSHIKQLLQFYSKERSILPVSYHTQLSLFSHIFPLLIILISSDMVNMTWSRYRHRRGSGESSPRSLCRPGCCWWARWSQSRRPPPPPRPRCTRTWPGRRHHALGSRGSDTPAHLIDIMAQMSLSWQRCHYSHDGEACDHSPRWVQVVRGSPSITWPGSQRQVTELPTQ